MNDTLMTFADIVSEVLHAFAKDSSPLLALTLTFASPRPPRTQRCSSVALTVRFPNQCAIPYRTDRLWCHRT